MPVGDATTCEEIAAEADETMCARTPQPFRAVGLWYDHFSQITDDEVRRLLERAAAERRAAPSRKTSEEESRGWS